MSILEIIGGGLMIVFSIVAVLLVLMQESTKGDGLSALSGGDSYFGKNQGRTLDAFLFKATKYVAIILFVVTIAVYAASVYLG